MTAGERSIVIGVFHEREPGRQAIDVLKDAGYAADSSSEVT